MEENKNVLVWVLAAAALLFLFGSFGMGGYGMMGFGTGFGSIFMLLFWGVLIWLVVTLLSMQLSQVRKRKIHQSYLKKDTLLGKYPKSGMGK